MKTVTEHLINLIRIPSASSLSNRPLIEYARGILGDAHWTSELTSVHDEAGVEKINLIAAPPGQDAHEPLVDLAFLCHTDTVPAVAGWSSAHEPFVDAGMIHGCGACDVKGFLACLLTAASTSGASFREGLRIVLTADEEIGCLGSHRLLAGDRLRPKALVIGEPTSLYPARAGKGYCLGEVTVFGAEAHSAHPQQGRSAIYDAAKLIQAIEQLAHTLTRETNAFFDPPYTTLNVGKIDGGTAKNIVPGQCRFLLEWRPVPGSPLQTVPSAVDGIIAGMKEADPAFRCDFHILRQQPGFETSADSKLVRSMERLTGRDATAIPFGSEGSVFASVAHEIVVFGPGDMRTAHSPRECVPIAELHEAVSCVRALMQG